MSFRINPLWWPLLIAASPVLAPVLIAKNNRYKANRIKADESNLKRIEQAEDLGLPNLDRLNLTVLVEEKVKEGFQGDAGVSYLFKTDQGSLLFDVGFGPERPALAHNANKLGVKFNQIGALAVSHLHPDHMGGLKASSSKQVMIPDELGSPENTACFLPDAAEAEGFNTEVVQKPGLLACGLGTTGPLSRGLFLAGYTEEQAVLARIKDKGLAVFTGCGHPTAQVILKMAQKLSPEPIYAFGGGLHFPITCSRGARLGIQFQQIIGTGKPPWQKINDEDLTDAIRAINDVGPQKVYLSAHDTCDYALNRLEKELNSETIILRAGETYEI